MPTLSQIRRINHAFAVGREIRASLPVRLFIMDFLVESIGPLGARVRLDLPKSARTVNVPPIRDKENLRTIRRPHRTDLVIHLAVVIARQRADILGSKLAHIADQSILEAAHEDMKVTLIG